MKKLSHPLRILHLEDQAEDAHLIEGSLKKAHIDFEIKVVDSKIEYETAIREFAPEVIISDHSLPSFNSIEAMHILQNSGLKIPFILVTGAVSEDFAVNMLTHGTDDYILKDRLHRLPVAILGALEKFSREEKRKKTEQMLLESEKQYKYLIQHLPAAIYSCDINGKIVIYNKAAISLWGKEPEIDELWCGAFKVYDRGNKLVEREHCPMATAVIEGREIAAEEFVIERPDGSKRIVLMNPVPNFNANGDVTGAICMITDITDLKKVQVRTLTLVDNLKCKNKELEQFTYMVSHVLRAPVARILGLGNILPIDVKNTKFIVGKIVKETNDLDNILKDINIILSARNSENERWEFVDVEEQFQLVCQVLSKEILESNAMITYNSTYGSKVYVIKSYLYSIIMHLFSNAIKFRSCDLPLSIHVEVNADDEFVRLSVKDNGEGFDLDQNGEKAFGLYQRFHGDEFPGNGSGLYLVKTYAEALGGKVQIESNLHQGTQVIVDLPKK